MQPNLYATAPELADRLKLHAVRRGREWRGDCPLCGYVAAFVLRQKEGRALLWCASCQDKDALGALLRGGQVGAATPRHDAAHRAAEAVDLAAKAARALALWNRAAPCPGTLAAVYLAARGLPLLASSPVLRFNRDTRHPGGGTLPAMVAVVQDVAGNPAAVHRTFLRPDGTGKASIDPTKASLGPVWGGAIRLDPIAPELTIGEGLETSAAAGVLLGLPAWAAISAGNLARGLVLPPDVRAVVIAADPDPPGEAAAQAAALRWKAEGRRVRIARPAGPGDFADLLGGRHDV